MVNVKGLKPYCPLQAVGWDLLLKIEEESSYIHHAVLHTEHMVHTILIISNRKVKIICKTAGFHV
jgi:hypothetical protein